MTDARLDAPAQTQSSGPEETPPQAPTLAPLRVSGLVVRKADLITALRVYIADLTDLQVTDDGEHFWLLLGEPGSSGETNGEPSSVLPR